MTATTSIAAAASTALVLRWVRDHRSMLIGVLQYQPRGSCLFAGIQGVGRTSFSVLSCLVRVVRYSVN